MSSPPAGAICRPWASAPSLESIPAFRWVSENSQIYAGAREKAAVMVKRLLADINLRANAAEGDGAEVEAEAEGGGAEAARGHRLTAALIGLSRRVAEDAGASWYLFDVPTRRSRTEFISTLYRMDLSPDLAGRAVSPLPLFAAAAGPDVKLFYERGHLHFTPLGNRLAAQALFERITRDSGERLVKCRRAA